MATLSFTNITANSATVYVSDLMSYSMNDRYVNYYFILNGSYQTIAQNIALPPSTIDHYSDGYYNITGLSPNTTYSIQADLYYYGGSRSITGNFTTLNSSAPPVTQRPPLFYWTYAKVQGQPFNLQAFEWNGLMQNINAVRQYKGTYTVTYTTAYSGYPFTAAQFNEAASAINGLYYSPPIAYVNIGDVVTASGLNNLVYYINNIQ